MVRRKNSSRALRREADSIAHPCIAKESLVGPVSEVDSHTENTAGVPTREAAAAPSAFSAPATLR